MSVNGVTSTQAAAAYSYNTIDTKAAEETKAANAAEEKKEDSGVIYEPSAEAQAASSAKKTYTPDTNLINKLKADAEARTAQRRSLVEKMMGGQATLTERPTISGSSCVPATIPWIPPQSCRRRRISRKTVTGV